MVFFFNICKRWKKISNKKSKMLKDLKMPTIKNELRPLKLKSKTAKFKTDKNTYPNLLPLFKTHYNNWSKEKRNFKSKKIDSLP